MVGNSTSITRRLIVMVLLLELLAAVGLVAVVTVHERHVEYEAFDANLRGAADSLMGAVSEADDVNDGVMLDIRGVHLGDHGIYRVVDEQGRVLGASGPLPDLNGSLETFQRVRVDGESYRFFVHSGDRIVDPSENGGFHHMVTITYGLPDGRVWHEVLESIRFFTIATAILMGITTLLMVWLVRKLLQPIHDLASAANDINSFDWQFNAPPSAQETDELRPLATALEATLNRLERSFEQQKRFTSDAAHELKTDLAIVKSSLQLLSMKKRTAEDYSRGLAISLDDFTRLEFTVQKMLTLARLEQPAETQGQSCLLRSAMEEAVQQSAPFAALRNISVAAHLSENSLVPLDSRDAVLLCSNILLNALQHSAEGSTVTVDLHEDGNTARLNVRDRGEGIRPEDLPYLFEPFYRGDPSRSRKSGGTGLGLSICQAICRRGGGAITIGNHLDGGAIVSVLLPLLAMKEEPALSASLKA